MVLILTNVIQDIIFKDRVEIEFRSNCLKSCAIGLSNALHLNLSKFSLLVVRTSSLLSHFSSFNILLTTHKFLSFPLLKFLESILTPPGLLVNHIGMKGRVAFLCLRLLYPFCHILSTSQKLD